MERWNVARSADLFNISSWGSGYFGINEKGHVCVTPNRESTPQIDLYDLVTNLTKRGIEAPLLIRFDGIVRDRVAVLHDAFAAAIQEYNYSGKYQLAFPIKVNQQRHVVDSVRSAGQSNSIGLEVGSKPELLAVLAIQDTPNGLLLCNGYKDAEYIELALWAKRLGLRPIIILEQPHEVKTVLEASERLGIEAEVGIRFKPASKGSGRWEGSAGDGAKFGLTSYEIMDVIKTLKDKGKDNWLRLLHFHVGSQITNISSLKRILKEATRMYAEIYKLMPSLEFMDVGGGLAVDYDGSRTNFESSMNYTTAEYARDIVWALKAMSEEEQIPNPNILSESGRAIAAHHSVLITEVADVSPYVEPNGGLKPPTSENSTLKEIYAIYRDLSVKNCHEGYHDAISSREEVYNKFVQGELSVEERAYADKAFKHLMLKITQVASGLAYVPEDLANLDDTMKDTYFCNFSVFQSLPDTWAIDQLFPIIPIHRLGEEPTRRAMISDLTCDSDGKIDKFIDLKEVKRYIKLHEVNATDSYYIGYFLVGAYQEILGDLHNLFGDTNAVHVDLDENGEVQITHVVQGDTIREVLQYVQFDPDSLSERLRISIDKGLTKGTITTEEAAILKKKFREGLEGYTYLVK